MDVLNSFVGRVILAAKSPVSSLRREEGQTFTEYAIIVAVVAVALVAALTPLTDAITNALQAAADAISGLGG